MEKVTLYKSGYRGKLFETEEEALADENRLPEIIAAYKSDLPEFYEGNSWGSYRSFTKEEAADMTRCWLDAICKYERQWAKILEERNK